MGPYFFSFSPLSSVALSIYHPNAMDFSQIQTSSLSMHQRLSMPKSVGTNCVKIKLHSI